MRAPSTVWAATVPTKANDQEAEDIVRKLSIPTPSTNLGTGDDLIINDTPQDTWGR